MYTSFFGTVWMGGLQLQILRKVLISELSTNLHGKLLLKKNDFRYSNSLSKDNFTEQILKALRTTLEMRLILKDLGTKDLKFIPRPVKVGLRYTVVSNLLFRLDMQISRKLSWLLFSTSEVNWIQSWRELI